MCCTISSMVCTADFAPDRSAAGWGLRNGSIVHSLGSLNRRRWKIFPVVINFRRQADGRASCSGGLHRSVAVIDTNSTRGYLPMCWVAVNLIECLQDLEAKLVKIGHRCIFLNLHICISTGSTSVKEYSHSQRQHCLLLVVLIAVLRATLDLAASLVGLSRRVR
jgi:hypothetical protein